jgi:hypothetical protein
VGAGKRVTAIQANRQHPTAIVSAGPIQRDSRERASMSTERVRVKVCIGDCCPHARVILVLRVLGSQGLSIYRPIIYGNTAVVLTPEERETHPSREHTHRWTVAVRSAASAEESDIVGGADDLTYFIRRVTFKLHETYPNPSRSK